MKKIKLTQAGGRYLIKPVPGPYGEWKPVKTEKEWNKLNWGGLTLSILSI